MNAQGPRFDELDARLRGLLGGIDADTGFEARVMQRVAARAAGSRAVPADLCAQFERRREAMRRRMRRETWSHAATVAGVGAAAAALVWRFAPELLRWAAALEPSIARDPLVAYGVALAAIGAGLWPVLRRMPALMK